MTEVTAVDARPADERRLDDLIDRLLAEHDPSGEPEAFLGAQFDLGLAAVHFPEGAGGLGFSPRLQQRVDTRVAAAGGPVPFSVNPIGVGMAAPTLATHGTAEQRQRYLRPLFTGEEIWCQLFSEPGAGSDVAGLSTRAVKDGDEWIVTGQKVWTTLGHLARFGLLLARSDPTVPKHRGLTYFVMDMHAPGVEVRPLFQMTGDAEFNEVYMTEVRVPDERRLGEPGSGWRVALTTLMNERVAIGGSVQGRGEGPIAPLVALWRRRGGTAVFRDRVAGLWARNEVLRLTAMRAAVARSTGTPGPEGSIGKLGRTELMKDVWSACIDLMGMEGVLYPDGYRMRRPQHLGERPSLQQSFLRSRANSIEGGTTEIMKNILAERVLGLPGDVRVDRDVPWSEVPRS